MASRNPRSRAQNKTPNVGERLAAMETELEALPEKMRLAVIDGLESIRTAFAAQIEAQNVRIAALESASRSAVAVSAVHQVQRTQLQEWARTLLPYVFTIAASVVGFRAFG